jgi:hypothetical protein
VTAVVREGESGLTTMLADLLQQNLVREPPRARLLRNCIATLQATDAGVATTLRMGSGRVLVADGAAARAHLRVRGSAERLLALAAAPLRIGLPDPMRAEGRAVLRDVVRGLLRIEGLLTHPLRALRLMRLLSAGP